MRYFIGIGSNIAPRQHVPLMLRALLQIAPALHVGRIVETVPVGVIGEPFLNAAACLSTDLTPQELKAQFNAIEARLGRDRAAADSKTKSRTADLDLLLWLGDDARQAPTDLLPHESYMRPMLLELLGYVGVTTAAEPLPLPPGLPLPLDALTVGLAPLTLTLVGGRILAAAA
ncbi:2-amino-4-hydroxy-6-hydroxymethyldihydropteridine diphosphokinase [Oscillochloris sp. ZM17-4]|uniref:2-amino-4-hydroxy-6- hydroxymethyldihydropteridine diphosphokinase n=1 Tax=Oscillochloris sp. ZM17-4 TaxID=2866714 RepID=UPI001C73C190|nr:2-amino-4-hydroxy-6-hydroxymethyldihydropteridine diphosphokinase [Oscillochloris sp. ZM17-4]MBX0331463.1 2-amino-4-hydroxy-6-hydroxymethyldihydropteridine diphosphokinase [Oscillochloris sp. ZM17-4]